MTTLRSSGDLTATVHAVEDAVQKSSPVNPFVLIMNSQATGAISQRSFPNAAIANQWLVQFGAADIQIMGTATLQRGFVA